MTFSPHVVWNKEKWKDDFSLGQGASNEGGDWKQGEDFTGKAEGSYVSMRFPLHSWN